MRKLEFDVKKQLKNMIDDDVDDNGLFICVVSMAIISDMYSFEHNINIIVN